MNTTNFGKVVWSGELFFFWLLSFNLCHSSFLFFFYLGDSLAFVFLGLISKLKSPVNTLYFHQIDLLKHPSFKIKLKRNLMLLEGINIHHCNFHDFHPYQHRAFRNPLSIHDFKSVNIFVSTVFCLDEWHNHILDHRYRLFSLNSYQHPIHNGFQILV